MSIVMAGPSREEMPLSLSPYDQVRAGALDVGARYAARRVVGGAGSKSRGLHQADSRR